MGLSDVECEVIENELIAARHSVTAFEAWARDVRKIPAERLATDGDGLYVDPEVKNLDACWADAWSAGRIYERMNPRRESVPQ